MSWLNTIVEGILNEIGAEDAYNRFYNSIPRDKYDEILDGETNVDKFMTFILNGVRDNLCDAEDAIQAVRAYKQADPLVRQAVLNNFRNGEYDSAVDVFHDINYLSHGNGVVNKKNFAKKGYIKLGGSDKWLVTCTTNYLANSHYFGTTHWCTASDRQGDYDGYEMFLRYAVNAGSVLIQFSNKSDEEEKYQVQCGMPYNDGIPNTDEICDFQDRRVSIRDLEMRIGDDKLFKILCDKEIITQLLDIQDKQKEAEKAYQEKMSAIIRRKEQIKHQRLEQKRREVTEDAEKKNAEEEKKIQAAWEQFFANEYYNNLEFITALCNRDLNDYGDEDSEDNAKYCYATITSIHHLGNDTTLLEIGHVNGRRYCCEALYDAEENLVDYGINEWWDDYAVGNVYVIVKSEYEGDFRHVHPKEILETGKITSEEQTSSLPVGGYCGDGSENGRRFRVLFDFNGNDCIFDSEKEILYPYRKNTANSVIYAPVELFVGNNGDLFMATDSGLKIKGLFQLTSDGDYWFQEDVDRRDAFKYGSTLVFPKDRRAISRYGREVKIPEEHAEDIIAVDCLGGTDNAFYWRLGKYGTKGTEFNAVEENPYAPTKYIFGIWGEMVKMSPNNKSIWLTLFVDGKKTIIEYQEDYSFYKRTLGNPAERCDKYGRTKADIEKERMAKKNFDDWQAAGGHSPEAKAEMDKMYSKYGNFADPSDGSNAFRDWNDDDRILDDLGDNQDSFHIPGDASQMIKSLQSFPNDERWRGAVGFKDPEGYSKEMGEYIGRAMADGNDGVTKALNNDAPNSIRRNPWYRIGKDGKPLDQPWYDEDEVPARLSDRVAENKRAHESLKKTIDLFNKLFD